MKHILLFVIIVLLLLPGFQKKTSIFKEKSLQGAFTLSEYDSLTKKNWYSGQFQQAYGTVFNDAIGFRPTLVRLNNQVNFSFFDQSSVNSIIVGKSGYLYEDTYLDAYTGKDKVKITTLRKKMKYVYKLQNYLEAKGIHFILIFAPSKGRILPEFIPSRYLSRKKGSTNYDDYIRIIGKEFPGIHFIDVNAYFNQLKKSVTIPLYPPGGTHWTKYASQRYFLDSLLHYMGWLRKKEFPELLQQNFRWSHDLESPDDDIRQTLNLLSSYKTEKLPYADFTISGDTAGRKPGLLVISDSYYSILYRTSAFNSLFNRVNFWFYNKTRFPEEYYQGNTDPDFLRDDLLQHDFVILLATEINIYDLFLFPENALSWVGLGDEETKAIEAKRQERIRYYINAIYNNPEWLNSIKIKAKLANKTLEETVKGDAGYMEQKEHQGEK